MMRITQLRFQANFNNVVEVQADPIIEHYVHKPLVVEYDISQATCVIVRVCGHDKNFLPHPFAQIGKFVSLVCVCHGEPS
jgi:hypothetical protein